MPAAAKECPMCTTVMRIEHRTITTHAPGNPQPKTTTYDEWVCPDCDYYEEVEEAED